MPPEVIIDPGLLNFDKVVADRNAIRSVNPQRHEMELLDAIVLLQPEQKLIAGYKDVRADEFWARGHFPEQPLYPGVLMCESAAQLCSYFIMSQHVIDDQSLMGFGGMENTRFRSVVRPGDRLALIAQATRLHRRQCVFNVQGFVVSAMAFHTEIIGVPLPRTAQ
jgi:3-hydroxyacyl-[acyl-carrier-protein] dehydratase